MTFGAWYQKGKNYLQKAGIESPAFDAVCLFQKVFGLDRQGLIARSSEEAPQDGGLFWSLIERRAQKEPLQYLLGEWEFLDGRLKVGEGVLIPREETELLVYTARDLLLQSGAAPGDPLKVLDLCAGTGAVGIGLGKLFPRSEIFCVEWYGEAFRYLEENIAQAGGGRVKAVRADVLSGPGGKFPALKGGFDALVSNPPYLETGELASLQEEVRREPRTALDGGSDGLDFYRAIAGKWLELQKPGGVLAVEIGESQGAAVKGLFREYGVQELQVYQDFNGLDRVVAGRGNDHV